MRFGISCRKIPTYGAAQLRVKGLPDKNVRRSQQAGARGLFYLMIERQPDRFRLGEILNGRIAMLTAQPRLAGTAPGQPNVGVAIGVAPHRAGFEPGRDPMYASNVRAPNAGRQTIRSTVGNAQCILLVLEGND